MLTAFPTNLNERRREMAILRSVGARPLHINLLVLKPLPGLAVYCSVCCCCTWVSRARRAMCRQLRPLPALNLPTRYEWTRCSALS